MNVHGTWFERGAASDGAERGYDGDSRAVELGLDYRLSERAVVGARAFKAFARNPMEKLEMRARARATARASRMFTPGRDQDLEGEVRADRVREKPAALPPAIDIIDETHARSSCKPMGELEYVVQSVDARGRLRALYVIVPDLALKSHYERLGFAIEPGCRVLLDAAALLPIAVMRVSCHGSAATPPKCSPAAGFNPYWDMPAA